MTGGIQVVYPTRDVNLGTSSSNPRFLAQPPLNTAFLGVSFSPAQPLSSRLLVSPCPPSGTGVFTPSTASVYAPVPARGLPRSGTPASSPPAAPAPPSSPWPARAAQAHRARLRGRGRTQPILPPPPAAASARGWSAAPRTALGRGPAGRASPWARAGAARRSGSHCWGPGSGLRRGPSGEAGKRRRRRCPRRPRVPGGCTGAAGWCCCSSRCWASRRAWSGTPGAPSRTRRARPMASPAGTSRCSCCGDPSASCPASRSCGSWTREVRRSGQRRPARSLRGEPEPASRRPRLRLKGYVR